MVELISVLVSIIGVLLSGIVAYLVARSMQNREMERSIVLQRTIRVYEPLYVEVEGKMENLRGGKSVLRFDVDSLAKEHVFNMPETLKTDLRICNILFDRFNTALGSEKTRAKEQALRQLDTIRGKLAKAIGGNRKKYHAFPEDY